MCLMLFQSSNTSHFFSQYYALQILETVIKTRWKILPRNQCEGQFLNKQIIKMLLVGEMSLRFPLKQFNIFSGIKKYVVGLIIKTSSDPANMEVKLH